MPGGCWPVIRQNRTASWCAVVAALTLVALPAAATDTKTGTTTDAKSDSRSATNPNAKPVPKSDAKPGTKSAPLPPTKPVTASKPVAAPKVAAHVPLPRARPAFAAPARTVASPVQAPAPPAPRAEPTVPVVAVAYAPPAPTPGIPLATAATASTPPADVDAIKQAISLVRAGKIADASAAQRGISDPLARKLVEWVILRSDDNGADFARYNAFIAANPSWPNMVMFRRRAEAMLWQERAPSATVRAYFAPTKPLSAKGRFALARALISDGDRAGAQIHAREAWRVDSFPADIEAQALELFGEFITRADEKARMDRRLYTTDDADAGLRAAKRLGGPEPAIAKARISVSAKAPNAKAQLDAVPAEVRHDAGYIFSRTQSLRRGDKIAEAGALMLTAPRDPAKLQDLDEWWVERRLLARKLLDIGDARLAYAVVRDAVPPTKDNYRAEHQFAAGWVTATSPSRLRPPFRPTSASPSRGWKWCAPRRSFMPSANATSSSPWSPTSPTRRTTRARSRCSPSLP